MTKTSIIITFQCEGFHCWPAAKDVFPEVGFLSDRHRHMFTFKAKKTVTHSDRDIEIIMFKRLVMHDLYEKYSKTIQPICEFGPMSCEMLAQEIADKFDCTYVEVLEDNENGACIEK